MRFSLFVAVAAALSFASADVEFTKPAAGDIVDGTTIEIEWTDSEFSPPISSLQHYQLYLCAGGNDVERYIQLQTLETNGDFSSNAVSLAIDPTIGASNIRNAYFLKMISATTEGMVINYSKRFSLTAMTGDFPPQIPIAMKDVSGTDGPESQNQILQINYARQAGAAEYEVPYTMQSGAVRFAPMPKVPPTHITAKNPQRLFPTSDWTAWLTNSGPPNAKATQTQPPASYPSSIEATISPAAKPMEIDMQKFLARWKD